MRQSSAIFIGTSRRSQLSYWMTSPNKAQKFLGGAKFRTRRVFFVEKWYQIFSFGAPDWLCYRLSNNNRGFTSKGLKFFRFFTSILILTWASTVAVNADRFYGDDVVQDLFAKVVAGQCKESCNLSKAKAKRFPDFIYQIAKPYSPDTRVDFYLIEGDSGSCGSRGCLWEVYALGTSRMWMVGSGSGEFVLTHPEDPWLITRGSEVFLPQYVGSRNRVYTEIPPVSRTQATTTTSTSASTFNTGDGNPLRDNVFLENALKHLGFFEPIFSFNVKLVADGGVARQGYNQSLPGNVQISYNSNHIAAMLVDMGILSLSPLNQDKLNHYRAEMDQVKLRSYLVNYAPAGLSEPQTKVRDELIEYSIPAAFRKVAYESKENWDFRTWTEGNVQYAMVTGYYNRVTTLKTSRTRDSNRDPSIASRIFKIIVENNPASTGWRLTNYRGEKSSIERRLDHSDYAPFFSHVFELYEGELERLAKIQQVKTYDFLANRYFRNYHKVGDILQISVESGRPILVDTHPFQPASPEVGFQQIAIERCASSNAGGYSNWKLPGQRQIAELLQGRTFDDWQKFRLKSLPDKRYWGQMLNRLMANQKKISDFHSHFLYFYSSDYKDQKSKSPPRVPYIVSYSYAYRTPYSGVFSGQLPNRRDFERAEHKRIFAFCVNDDPADNNAFLSGSAPSAVSSVAEPPEEEPIVEDVLATEDQATQLEDNHSVQDSDNDSSKYAGMNEKQRVEIVQTELSRLLCEPGPVDGQLGKKTKRAYEKYLLGSGSGLNENSMLTPLGIVALVSEKSPVCSAAWLAENNPSALAGIWYGVNNCKTSNGRKSKRKGSVNLRYNDKGQLEGSFKFRWKDFWGRTLQQSGTTAMTLNGQKFSAESKVGKTRSNFTGKFSEKGMKFSAYTTGCSSFFSR